MGVMVATDTSARGPLMPNPKLMPNPRPMPPLMPGMATTATPDTTVMAVDTTVWDTPAVITVMVDTTDTPTVMVDTVDTMVDTGVKLVNSTPNHFFHPKP